MKEYFSHDYNARDDEKMPKLLSELGYEGYGIYWAVVEMLYKNDGYMQLDCKSIAFALHCDSNCLTKVINDFDLFVNDGGKFYSESVLKRLGIRKDISEKRSNAAKVKWNANAEQKDNKSNAIKEKKIKGKDRIGEESKEKNILYQSAIDIYCIWFTNKFGIKAKIDSVQGKALKSILSYLKIFRGGNSSSEEQILQDFNAIFHYWDRLDKFYQSKTKLSEINSNLQNIINQLKNGQKPNKVSDGDLDRIISEAKLNQG